MHGNEAPALDQWPFARGLVVAAVVSGYLWLAIFEGAAAIGLG